MGSIYCQCPIKPKKHDKIKSAQIRFKVCSVNAIIFCVNAIDFFLADTLSSFKEEVGY